jgi:tetratricopeptide (TPR) repeat protein
MQWLRSALLVSILLVVPVAGTICFFPRAAVAQSLRDAQRLNERDNELYQQDRYADAEPLLKHAPALSEKALGPNHPDVAASLNNSGILYNLLGRYADAEAPYKRSLEIRETMLKALPTPANSRSMTARKTWAPDAAARGNAVPALIASVQAAKQHF